MSRAHVLTLLRKLYFQIDTGTRLRWGIIKETRQSRDSFASYEFSKLYLCWPQSIITSIQLFLHYHPSHFIAL